MAWTAPRTWTTGELVTKTILDTHIRDNEIYLKTAVDAAVLRAGDTMAGTLQTSVNIGMRHTDDA